MSAVIAWLGSILGPIYIYIGWGDFKNWPLFVGLGLVLYVAFSIRMGFGALGKGIYSDFLVYAVAPLVIPASLLVGLWVYIG